VKYQFVQKDAKLLGTKRTFQKYGRSGIEVSDLFPHMAQCVDDLAVIRSCHGDMVVHSAAQYELFTGGSFRVIRAWDHGSRMASDRKASRCRLTWSCRILKALSKAGNRCKPMAFCLRTFSPRSFARATVLCSTSLSPEGSRSSSAAARLSLFAI
jgi:hypothetical protein